MINTPILVSNQTSDLRLKKRLCFVSDQYFTVKKVKLNQAKVGKYLDEHVLNIVNSPASHWSRNG